MAHRQDSQSPVLLSGLKHYRVNTQQDRLQKELRAVQQKLLPREQDTVFLKLQERFRLLSFRWWASQTKNLDLDALAPLTKIMTRMISTGTTTKSVQRKRTLNAIFCLSWTFTDFLLFYFVKIDIGDTINEKSNDEQDNTDGEEGRIMLAALHCLAHFRGDGCS